MMKTLASTMSKAKDMTCRSICSSKCHRLFWTITNWFIIEVGSMSKELV